MAKKFYLIYTSQEVIFGTSVQVESWALIGGLMIGGAGKNIPHYQTT